MNLKFLIQLAIILVLLQSCSKEDLIVQLQDIDITKTETGIVPLPNGFHKKMNEVFTKYTKITAQNGRPIHLFAQSGVDDEKLMRAREILRMYLSPVPNSEYGSYKFFVANSMADRNAALFFFDTQDSYESSSSKLQFVPFNWQDLYATESILPGSSSYIYNEPRDATFEEILHMVQDFGITPMMPLYQKEISLAAEKAVRSNVYNPPSDLPQADHDQEYLASVWDVYRDAWRYTAPPAQYGEYLYNTRESLKQKDPDGYGLITRFLPEYLTYNARLDASFDGFFHLDLKSELSYTFKSQYLLNVTLTGNLNSGLRGNNKDNHLTGNSGNNQIAGSGGDDTLDGLSGKDTAVFTGKYSEYAISTINKVTTIKDLVKNRDGRDSLTNIEALKFSDQTITL